MTGGLNGYLQLLLLLLLLLPRMQLKLLASGRF
jgi:hypothetical protein